MGRMNPKLKFHPGALEMVGYATDLRFRVPTRRAALEVAFEIEPILREIFAEIVSWPMRAQAAIRDRTRQLRADRRLAKAALAPPPSLPQRMRPQAPQPQKPQAPVIRLMPAYMPGQRSAAAIRRARAAERARHRARP